MNQQQNRDLLVEKLSDIVLQLVDSCQTRQEKIASKSDIMVAEFKALRYFGRDKVLTVGELARRMGLSNSRLTRIIDGLVNKGLIKRYPGIKDRRVIEIKLTIKGEKKKDILQKSCFSVYKEIIDCIPVEKSKKVISVLEELQIAIMKTR